jgi:hypothetical protein
MGRREARIERNNKKILDQQEKNARLVEVVKSDHVPRIEVSVSSAETPRAAEDPGSIMQMRMMFKMLECADRTEQWSWGQGRNWCSPEHSAENACAIRSFMIEMSALYWHEIHSQTTGGRERHRKHHAQSWDSICDEAQRRWLEIGRDEEELFRFRAGGRERLWGFRAGHVFYLVWWDAEHQIYPVD